jgi:hypothetical protein
VADDAGREERVDAVAGAMARLPSATTARVETKRPIHR